MANLHIKLPIFRVKSVKIYTGQKKFTPAPPVAPVTNMRYVFIFELELMVTQVLCFFYAHFVLYEQLVGKQGCEITDPENRH